MDTKKNSQGKLENILRYMRIKKVIAQQKLRGAAKASFKGKFITVNADIKKERNLKSIIQYSTLRN